jgi:hypothetical protein
MPNINFNEINQSALKALVTILDKEEELAKREWCLLSAVDDRLKYVSITIVDRATGIILPIKLNRFNELYFKYDVIYGIMHGVMRKYSGVVDTVPINKVDIEHPGIRAAGKTAVFDQCYTTKKGTKIYLYSWGDSIII